MSLNLLMHACRLKQATVMRQEDEEDSVRWRVEAEVRLAVDRAQQAAAQQEAQMHKDMADLNAELTHAQEQLDSQSSDLSAWRDAVAAKDLEIQNLQVSPDLQFCPTDTLPLCHIRQIAMRCLSLSGLPGMHSYAGASAGGSRRAGIQE